MLAGTLYLALPALVGVCLPAQARAAAAAATAATPPASAASRDLDSSSTSPRSGSPRRYIPQVELAAHSRQERQVLAWELQQTYAGTTFFDGFDFFDGDDPSHGAVNYVDQETAFGTGLAFWTQSGTAGIQAEHWQYLPTGPGTNPQRDSVRISSKQLYGGGLFVVDLGLLPWGCGVWPAVWLLGYEDQWPWAGEIDIVEGVQAATRNQMTVHTGPGCSITQNGSFTGTVLSTKCDSSQGNSGCSIASDSNVSYGDAFNQLGGGVFATLWNGDGIAIWNWARDAVPWDVTGGIPQPQTWGAPVAAWAAAGCDPYAFFKPATMILNVNLCGSGCPGTCAECIADPANLQNTVMLVNSIKIYQQAGLGTAAVGFVDNYANLTGMGGGIGSVRRTGEQGLVVGSGGSSACAAVDTLVGLVALLTVSVLAL